MVWIRTFKGLDLTSGKNSGYLDAPIVLPEYKTFELCDKCPTVNNLIKHIIPMDDEITEKLVSYSIIHLWQYFFIFKQQF